MDHGVILEPSMDLMEWKTIKNWSFLQQNIFNFHTAIDIFHRWRTMFQDLFLNLSLDAGHNHLCWNEFFSVETFEGYFLGWCYEKAINDITFSPHQGGYWIKIAKENRYYCWGYIDKNIYEKIINQWKIITSMDLIDPKPQSAVIQWQWGRQQFNTRISLWPTVFGTKVSVRVLHNQYTYLESLGLNKTVYNQILSLIKEPTLLAIMGPVGTGKTSLAYGIARQLVASGLHVMSIEDPVEYYCDFFDQGIVNDMTINHLMRHGIHTIFVGEILDVKGAQQVIQLMATGHGVITTFHGSSIEDLQYRWLSLGSNFYKGYGFFPKIVQGQMLVEIYNMAGELLSLSYEDQKINH